jgi:hypothetical protein
MHPSFSYQLAQDRISELREQAKRAIAARTARSVRRQPDRRAAARRLHHAFALAPKTTARRASVALIAVDGRFRPWLLAARLRAALEAHVSVAMLDSAVIPSAMLADNPAAVYRPLLDSAEAAHDLVLLVGGLDLDEPWTEFCRRHAGRILAVTGGGPVPPEVHGQPDLQGCELVAYDAEPGTLHEWAAALDPVESHVIREREVHADIAGMARRLAGVGVPLDREPA